MCATGTRSARPIEAPSTVVIVSPWTSTSGFPGPTEARGAAAARDRANVRELTRREPAGDVAVRPQVAAAGAAREPEVGLPQPELRRGRRGICCDLLAGRREHVAVPALLEPEEHGRELDQLAGRPEDDEDHAAPLARRCRARSARPRHIPAPWATA